MLFSSSSAFDLRYYLGKSSNSACRRKIHSQCSYLAQAVSQCWSNLCSWHRCLPQSAKYQLPPTFGQFFDWLNKRQQGLWFINGILVAFVSSTAAVTWFKEECEGSVAGLFPSLRCSLTVIMWLPFWRVGRIAHRDSNFVITGIVCTPNTFLFVQVSVLEMGPQSHLDVHLLPYILITLSKVCKVHWQLIGKGFLLLVN